MATCGVNASGGRGFGFARGPGAGLISLFDDSTFFSAQLDAFFTRQHEEAQCAALSKLAAYLPGDRRAKLRKVHSLNGSVNVGRTDYFYAARAYRRSHGVDIDQRYREIPIE